MGLGKPHVHRCCLFRRTERCSLSTFVPLPMSYSCNVVLSNQAVFKSAHGDSFLVHYFHVELVFTTQEWLSGSDALKRLPFPEALFWLPELVACQPQVDHLPQLSKRSRLDAKVCQGGQKIGFKCDF